MVLGERFYQMSNAIFYYDLTPVEFVAYSYLVCCAGQKNMCWPSVHRIAVNCNCSENTARKAVTLAGNAEMIAHGCGIISVPIEKQRDFTMLLINFYESGDMAEIKDYLYEGCIDGIDFPEMDVEKEEPTIQQTFGGM